MNSKTVAFLVLILNSNFARGVENSFDGINCDSHIKSALIGRFMQNERVALAEEKYKDIKLKYLWSDGMEFDGDPWTLNSWMICGKEHLLLKRKNIIKDVLSSPENFANYKFEFETCKIKTKEVPGTSVFFVPSQDVFWPKTVDKIWAIDDDRLKFNEIKTGAISCGM